MNLYWSGMSYTYSMFVFNSNRWRYCQLQPKQLSKKVKKMQIFRVESLLRIMILRIFSIQYQVESGSFWLHFALSPSSELFSTAKFKFNQCLIARTDCKWPCFDQLKHHILKRLLFCWRSWMCRFSWAKHGRLQSALALLVLEKRVQNAMFFVDRCLCLS